MSMKGADEKYWLSEIMVVTFNFPKMSIKFQPFLTVIEECYCASVFVCECNRVG
jgi:hypothetical protein